VACTAEVPGAVRELVATWAKVIGLLALARAASLLDPTGLLSGNLAAIAAVLFIALPERVLRRRGETWEELGLPWWGAGDARTWSAWATGAVRGAAVCAVVFPAFAVAWWGYAELLPRLAAEPVRWLAPYALPVRFEPRLPRHFALLAVSQLLVVALPEEMFYRGFLQTSWSRLYPSRRMRVLGAELGAGFVGTQLLFALGHLVSLQPWRVATFFPGLLFGWVRARTGSLAAPVVVHALSNLFLAVLEASFLGLR
jgi:hypothetical protein